MSETIPVYIKGTDKIITLEPAPKNQVIQADQETAAQPKELPKVDAKATAKNAKVTLVLDPLSLTRVYSEGKKQTKLIITVGSMRFDMMINSKSYRKALATLDELGPDGCTVLIQGSMQQFGKLEAAGLAVQPKAPKPAADQKSDT